MARDALGQTMATVIADMKGGDGKNKDEGRCPRCGTHLTQISPNQRVTTYCRTCQK